MKIIENNYNPVRQKCRNCGSVLEIEKDDIQRSEYIGYPYFICPLCKEKNVFYTEEFMEDAIEDFHKRCRKFFGFNND